MREDYLTPESVGDLALAAIDAAVQPQAWGELCDRMVDLLGAKAFFVFAFNLRERSIPLVFGSRVVLSQGFRELEKAADDGAGDEDAILYREMSLQPAGAVKTEHELYRVPAGSALPSNAWRDMMLGVTQGRARHLMKLNDVGPFLDCVAAHFEDGERDGPRFAAVAPVVAPILFRTLESTRTIDALAESYELLMNLFDRLDFGAAFCSSNGKVITSNAAFKRLAREGDGLKCEASGLCADDHAATSALRELVAAAARPTTPPGELKLSLSRRHSRLPLIVCAAPIRDREFGASPVVLLLTVDPEDERRLNADGLASFGVLTQAEIEVCNLLVRGFSTESIAEQRGTGLVTARNQILSAATKLDCKSRMDVLRLALTTSAPVSNRDCGSGSGP